MKKLKLKYIIVVAVLLLAMVGGTTVLNKVKNTSTGGTIVNNTSQKPTAQEKTIPGKIYATDTIGNNKIIIRKDLDNSKNEINLLDTEGNIIFTEDLESDFGMPVKFDNEFKLNKKDFNGDSKLDFAIGQEYSDGKKFRYVIYTVTGSKIEKLNFSDKIIVGNVDSDKYSPDFKTNGYNSLIIPVKYDSGSVGQKLYMWDRKTNLFNMDRVLSEKDNSSYMPEFKTQSLIAGTEAKFATAWKNSDDKKLSACIEGKGTEAIEEGVAKLYIKDLGTKDIKSFEIVNKESSKKTPKYLEWKDNENLLVIVGEAYGTVSDGGNVYLLNVNTGKLSLVYNALTTKQEVVSIKKVQEGYEFTLKVYDDDNFKNSHKEKAIMSSLEAGVLKSQGIE